MDGSPSRPPLRAIILLPLIAIMGPVGNVLLSKGMKNVSAPPSWTPGALWSIFLSVFTSPYIWLGIGSLVSLFLIYMLLLTTVDFSFAQPVTSMSYVVVGLLGYFWLGEKIVPLRWVGIAIICGGVMIIATTPHRTTPNAAAGKD
jgi:bacterial/archaeal transporter family protein